MRNQRHYASQEGTVKMLLAVDDSLVFGFLHMSMFLFRNYFQDKFLAKNEIIMADVLYITVEKNYALYSDFVYLIS
ncbi:hypothetical protein T06_841 [Trichinella sp. T6]|nr:hypothetical protein T06_841 [Trichinella sp. T6]